jgi:hypothetical protein
VRNSQSRTLSHCSIDKQKERSRVTSNMQTLTVGRRRSRSALRSTNPFVPNELLRDGRPETFGVLKRVPVHREIFVRCLDVRCNEQQ